MGVTKGQLAARVMVLGTLQLPDPLPDRALAQPRLGER